MTYEWPYVEERTRIRKFGIYRHYKGGYYQVLAIAIHSDTGEFLVMYKNIEEPRITWTRPASTWFDNIGNGVKRFVLQEDICEPIAQPENEETGILSLEGRIAEFTGGKWIKVDNTVYSEFATSIAIVFGDTDSEKNANARLIASAPEMYRLLLDVVRNDDIYKPTEKKIEALINYIDGKKE